MLVFDNPSLFLFCAGLLTRDLKRISLNDLNPWDDIIDYISKTGIPVLPWPILRRLLITYFSLTLQLMVTQTRVEIPDLENNVTEQSLISAIEEWQSPPFTLQRIGELLIEQIRPPDAAVRHPSCPSRTKRHYRNPTSFLIAFAKCVVGISDVEHKVASTITPVLDPSDFLFYDKAGQHVILRSEDRAELINLEKTRHMRVLGVGPLTPESRQFEHEDEDDVMGQQHLSSESDFMAMTVDLPSEEHEASIESVDFSEEMGLNTLTSSAVSGDGPSTPRKRHSEDEQDDIEGHPRKRSASESRSLTEDMRSDTDMN